jgi:hypothetical protein
MLDRRHVNQKAPRQSDVRSNARAFLGDRLFGNLHQNLLAFAQEIGNGRLSAIVSRRPAPSASWWLTTAARPAFLWLRALGRFLDKVWLFLNHFR